MFHCYICTWLPEKPELWLYRPLSAKWCLWFLIHSLWLRNPVNCSPPGFSVHGDSPGKNTGVGCRVLLRIVPTQGLNPGLPHWRWILCHLSHQGNPRILEWVAYPFSRGTSWPRNQTRILLHCRRILHWFFTSWTTREAWLYRLLSAKWCLWFLIHHWGLS